MAQDLGAIGTRDVAATAQRVEWLDGVRALAAFFVVIHHCWLMTVGGYPGNNGPWFTDWLVYGHLAVSVFIVVSGFSLTLSVSAHGMRLKEGGWGFLRRRFWRIVPPYWAALIFVTVLIGLGVTGPANGTQFGPRDFGVHFLLLQDAFGNVSPNGAFWSIAVEWHIYFLFPLVVVGFRRYGISFVLPAVAALAIGQQLVGRAYPLIGELDRFMPAYLVLFVAGASAASLVQRGERSRIWIVLAAILASAAAAYMILAGSERATAAFFWVDLVVGFSVAALFVVLARGRLKRLVRFLSASPLTFVGTYAFSLYLVHAPVLAILTTYLVRPAQLDSVSSLALLLVVGCPASLGFAYLFFLVCERPFLTIRSLSQLAAALGRPFHRKEDSSNRSRAPKNTKTGE